MIDFVLGLYVRFYVCLSVSPSLPLVCFRQLLRYADTRIVSIMKESIERNNLQVELIRHRKKCWLYSGLLLQSDGFNATLPTEWTSGSFEHKPVWSQSFLNIVPVSKLKTPTVPPHSPKYIGHDSQGRCWWRWRLSSQCPSPSQSTHTASPVGRG